MASHCMNCDEYDSDLEECMFLEAEFMVCKSCSRFWECTVCDMHVCEQVFTNNDETFGECEECHENCCLEHRTDCAKINCTKAVCGNCIGSCYNCDSEFCLTHLPYECRECEKRFCYDEDGELKRCFDGCIQEYCTSCFEDVAKYCDSCFEYRCVDCEHGCELSDNSVDDSVDSITDGIAAANLNDAGGVYCVVMKSIVTAKSGTNNITFQVDGNVDHNYVLIKFGRTNGFKGRLKCLVYDTIFVRDYHTSAENFCLRLFEKNAFKTVYHQSSTVKTIAAELKLRGEPGLTEWRIVTRAWLDAFTNLSSDFTLDNYRDLMSKFRAEQDNIEFDTGRLTICVGNYSRSNEIPMSVHNF